MNTNQRSTHTHTHTGTVSKKDVVQASIMLEHKREWATILAFDVSISKDARDLAGEMGVKIFEKDIIYHLFDAFTEYLNELDEARRESHKNEVVFPVVLDILPEYIFARKNPIILGVKVVEGILRVGTPLCFVKEDHETVRYLSLSLSFFVYASQLCK